VCPPLPCPWQDPKNITREEALEVRQTCLDALRARLVERANIIQSRLNDENAKLAREQVGDRLF
jgi:hypothetical protein